MRSIIPLLFLFACSNKTSVIPEISKNTTIYCSDTVNYTEPATISYRETILENGDALVSGSIQVKSEIFLATKQYDKKFVRISELPISLKYDLFMSNNGGNWMVSLDRDKMLMKMYYYDRKDVESVSFTSAKCSVIDLEQEKR